MKLETIMLVVLKLSKTEEGREELRNLINQFREEYEPTLQFIKETVGPDANQLFNSVQDFVVDKTTRAFDAYTLKGFSRSEALQLVINQRSELMDAARKR